MPIPEQPSDDLQAAVDEEKILIRVLGRGSFKVSTTLKQFIASMTQSIHVGKVVIDLKECVGMDSTFMGVLAGLSGRLKKVSIELEVINLSEKNANLLDTLGVSQVLTCFRDPNGYDDAEGEVKTIPMEKSTQKQMAITALQAHEKLAEISEENQPRFKSVIDLLKEDVNRLK